jgi:hypothetical protein
VQVLTFIDRTSGFPNNPNNNLYYLNMFHLASITGSTGQFQENGSSRTVIQNIHRLPPRPGTGRAFDLQIPLEDLYTQFQLDSSGLQGGKRACALATTFIPAPLLEFAAALAQRRPATMPKSWQHVPALLQVAPIHGHACLHF